MKIITTNDIKLREFEFWGQARYNVSKLNDEILDLIEEYLSRATPTPTYEKINTLFYENFNELLNFVGLRQCEICDEVIDINVKCDNECDEVREHITVSVDFGEGDILEYKVFNQTKVQMTNLFNNYNKEYAENMFTGNIEEYMMNENVEFEEFTFDLKLSV